MITQNTKSGKFKPSLSDKDIALRNALRSNLGHLYYQDIDDAIDTDNKTLLHDLMGKVKARLHGE